MYLCYLSPSEFNYWRWRLTYHQNWSPKLVRDNVENACRHLNIGPERNPSLICRPLVWILDLHFWMWVWKCSSLWSCLELLVYNLFSRHHNWTGFSFSLVWRVYTVYLCLLTFNIPSELVTKTCMLRYGEDACCHLNTGPEKKFGLICRHLGLDSWIVFLDVIMNVLSIVVMLRAFGLQSLWFSNHHNLTDFRFRAFLRVLTGVSIWCFLTTGASLHFKPRALEHWVILSIFKSTIMILDIFSVQILNPYICTSNIINTI